MKRMTLIFTMSALITSCSSNQDPQNGNNSTENPLLSSQSVISSTVSLSVLPPVGNRVTAVVSSPYPSATACTLDWGDGSTTSVYVGSPFASPKYDHEYTDTASPSKTITFSCIARKLVLSSKSVTISLEASTILDFESPIVTSPDSAIEYTNYNEKGYNIAVTFILPHAPNFYIVKPSQLTSFSNFNLTSQAIVNCRGIVIKRNDLKLFNFDRFDLSIPSRESVYINGYYADNTIISQIFDSSSFFFQTSSLSPMLMSKAWKNLAKIEIFHNMNCSAFDNFVMTP
jgi:hypothetical protein